MPSEDGLSDGPDDIDPTIESSLADSLSRLPRAGMRVGSWLLLDSLGRGGQGEVWSARHRESGQLVALKVVHEALTDSQQRATDFDSIVDKQRLAQRIDHPAVARVHDFGHADGWIWIAQELVAGGRSLHDLIASTTRAATPPDDWLRRCAALVWQIAEGLEALHRGGLIHCDLKPSNILLTTEGRPKITDLGLAQLADRELQQTLSGRFVGTALYASPEQFDRPDNLDDRTDIYSLGVILYELCTLRRPIVESSLLGIVRSHMVRDPEAPHQFTETPEPLSRVCMRCLEKRPRNRYRSATDLAEDLRRFLDGSKLRTPRPTPLRQLVRRVERRPWVSAAIGLAILLTLALVSASSRNSVVEAALRESDSWASTLTEVLEREPQLTIDPESVEELRAILATRRPSRNSAFERLVSAEFDDTLIGRLFEDEYARGADGERVWSLERRLREAERIADQFRRAGADRWERTLAELASDSRFQSVEFAPDAGLFPLGPDPHSGLQEFAVLGTGIVPGRDPLGRLNFGETSAVVLCLLPPGDYFRGHEATPGEGLSMAELRERTANWREYAKLNDVDSTPATPVSVDPFLLSKFELTQGQWRLMTGENPSGYRREETPHSGAGDITVVVDDTHPVERITPAQARRQLAIFGLGLPSESQWEYAARAGTTTRWTGGNALSELFDGGHVNIADGSLLEYWPTFRDVATTDDQSDGHPLHAPVDALTPNPFGLAGMAGNVWEVCADVYNADAHAILVGDGPVLEGNDPSTVSIRGGGFKSPLRDATPTERWWQNDGQSKADVGVRPARPARWSYR